MTGPMPDLGLVVGAKVTLQLFGHPCATEHTKLCASKGSTDAATGPAVVHGTVRAAAAHFATVYDTVRVRLLL